jgi:hypothetical protein
MIDNLFRSSPRMFFNNISVSLRQLSILLGDSTKRFGMKRTKIYNSLQKSKELHKNVKTTSGSHSEQDASIQAKKSHATVPLRSLFLMTLSFLSCFSLYSSCLSFSLHFSSCLTFLMPFFFLTRFLITLIFLPACTVFPHFVALLFSLFLAHSLSSQF